ncbi:MAG: biotin/lipoyl-binding protein [Nitrospirales bacterium]|nr:biotin/lipoyl-binding protein [Nitrospirales bacterium]
MRRGVLSMAAVLFITLTACSSGEKAKETVSAPVFVKTGTPQIREDFETLRLSGTIASPETPAHVSFIVSGRVVQVGPREGEYVRKGQFLASLDRTDYQLTVATATAQTEMARIGFERASDEHRRMKILSESNSITPMDYQKLMHSQILFYSETQPNNINGL